jgi:F420-non-reducing hydrogenase large subunit
METVIKEKWNEGLSKADNTYMKTRRVTIDPITRLEGHGKIDILLDEKGDVEHAYYQIPEIRGFETFCLGRPAEEMPQITSRICGVCPTAHHMAATKALDSLYSIEPPPTGRKLRELIYNAFMLEDHALHVYILGGPDFIVGPTAEKSKRNVLGVIEKVGLETGKRVIEMRRKVRNIINYLGGKVIHPVFGLPGGVAKGLAPSDLPLFKEIANEALDFAKFTLQVFKDIVLKNDDYVKMITSDAYTHKTYYMGMVDEKNRVNFYDGKMRVVDPAGKEFAKFEIKDYLEHIAERVEPWSYVKFNYLKKLGWKGYIDGSETSVYAVAPLARLNAADGMATEEAQKAYEEYFNFLGGKPVHHTLANHWARVVEILQAAERIVELVNDPEITGDNIRTIPTAKPVEGIGAVEAPRGTLIHHFKTDERGILNMVNLIVATQNNSARIAMSIDKAAKDLIHGGKADDGLLNMIEMAFRAYDPCNGCATHALPGTVPVAVYIYDNKKNLLKTITN